MPQGFQTFNSSGVLITDVQDRLTVLYAKGQVTFTYNGTTYPPVVVSVPGITTDLATWYVACTDNATAVPGNGVVTFYIGSTGGVCSYSVFRR